VTDCHQFAGFEPMIDFEVRDSIVISKHALPKISIIWIQARAEDCSFGMTIVLKPTALSRWGLLGAVLYRKMVYFSDTSSFSRALRLCNSLVLSQDRQIRSNHIRNKITCRFRFSVLDFIASGLSLMTTLIALSFTRGLQRTIYYRSPSCRNQVNSFMDGHWEYHISPCIPTRMLGTGRRFLERGRKSVWSWQVKAYASSVVGHAFKIPHDSSITFFRFFFPETRSFVWFWLP